MEIKLYTTTSPRKKIIKSLNNANVLNGTFRSQTSAMSPTFTIETGYEIMQYNYCYIPIFNRYYYINKIKALRNNLFELELTCDVLMSNADAILSNVAIIDKVEQNESAYLYINDGSYINTNRMKNSIINYPQGFLDNGEFILITAGGMA